MQTNNKKLTTEDYFKQIQELFSCYLNNNQENNKSLIHIDQTDEQNIDLTNSNQSSENTSNLVTFDPTNSKPIKNLMLNKTTDQSLDVSVHNIEGFIENVIKMFHKKRRLSLLKRVFSSW
jgi:hypothetical protein